MSINVRINPSFNKMLQDAKRPSWVCEPSGSSGSLLVLAARLPFQRTVTQAAARMMLRGTFACLLISALSAALLEDGLWMPCAHPFDLSQKLGLLSGLERQWAVA